MYFILNLFLTTVISARIKIYRDIMLFLVIVSINLLIGATTFNNYI